MDRIEEAARTLAHKLLKADVDCQEAIALIYTKIIVAALRAEREAAIEEWVAIADKTSGDFATHSDQSRRGAGKVAADIRALKFTAQTNGE